MKQILKERPDLLVYREDGCVYQQALTPIGQQEIETSWRFLTELEGTSIAPVPYSLHDNTLCMEYIENQSVTDEEILYRSAVRALMALRERNIVHGDMTLPNLRVRDNQIVIIDWGEAVKNTHHSKREGSDADHLWPALLGISTDTTRRVRRWIAIREHMREFFGWGRFEDIGTYEGDFCAFAATEGMNALGIDRVWKRERIRHLWGGTMPFDYLQTDITDHVMQGAEVKVMFSMWPYIIENYGLEMAEAVLFDAVKTSRVLFFETQYMNDGPGPSFLANDKEAEIYLSGFGETEKIITIPVSGRPCSRTVWKIT